MNARKPRAPGPKRPASSEPPLVEIVARLAAHHGRLAPPRSTDPWEHILRENVAYLVDDARREETFRALRDRIGTSPEEILDAAPEALARVIEHGGMQPDHRARKLVRCAELAQEIGLQTLRDAVAAAGPDAAATAMARRLLKKFPGISDPGADKLLLFAHRAITLAPDSNALRVLVRLGFAEEQKDYAATYRAAATAVSPQLPGDTEWLVRAHQLLRRHGQELCRRSEPQCRACPLGELCPTGRATL